jgi:hypothetical protein
MFYLYFVYFWVIKGDRQYLSRSFVGLIRQAAKLSFIFLFLFADNCYSNSLSLIKKAFLEGEISKQESINYQIDALFFPEYLPKVFQSNKPVKSATSALLEAGFNRGLIYPENHFIFSRPDAAGETGSDYYGNVEVLTYDSAGGSFKIHYTEDNKNGDAVYGSDLDKNTIPPFVVKVAESMEYSRGVIISGLGIQVPNGDGGLGGDNRFDVYLMSINAYGYTYYGDSPASDSYTVLHNDFLDPEMQDNLSEDPQLGAMQATSAHEFFHSCQLQYAAESINVWWMEASAVWVEDRVYPEVKDYLGYLGQKYDDENDNRSYDDGETYYKNDGITVDGNTGRAKKWFDYPENSLDHKGSFIDTHEYGTMIWVKYLTQIHGEIILKDIWESMGQGMSAAEAVDFQILARKTDFATAFSGFQVKNYKRDYPEGNYYPHVRHEGVYTTFQHSLEGELNHQAARFYAFKGGDTILSPGFIFNDMNNGVFTATVLLQLNDNSYTESMISLDQAEKTFRINDFGVNGTYKRAILIIMNISSDKDEQQFSITVADSISETEDSGGCLITTVGNNFPAAMFFFITIWVFLVFLTTLPARENINDIFGGT